MRQINLVEILHKLRSQPALLKKLKIVALVAVLGVVTIGGITLWATVSAVKFAIQTANQAELLPTAKSQLERIETEVRQFQARQFQVQPINCWGKVQKLLTAQAWLERPPIDNFRNLKLACLESNPKVCNGSSCETIEDVDTTNEGTTI